MVINEAVKSRFDIEKELLEYYNSIYVIDVNELKLIPVMYGHEVALAMSSDIDEIQDYNELFSCFADRFVLPDQQEEFIKVSKIENVIKNVDEYGRFVYTFRRFNLGDEIEYVEMSAKSIDEIHYMVTFRSITDNIRQYNVRKGFDLSESFYERVKPTLLIIDMNSEISELAEVLGDEYTIVTAATCIEGMRYLQENMGRVRAVIFDILTLKDAGFEYLKILASDSYYGNIPVLVSTDTEEEDIAEKCIQMGAADFISKPYTPSFVRRRVKNMITLGESEAMISAVEKDVLTNVYTKEAFYHASELVLKRNRDKHYSLFLCDIEQFKLLNSQYGKEACDKLLKTIASYLKMIVPHGLVGRFGRDQFVVMTETYESISEEHIINRMNDMVAQLSIPHIVLKISVYENVPNDMPVSNVCDRLLMAVERIKGKYYKHVVFYDSAMRKALMEEHMIVDYMEESLADGSFEIYYQGKFDCASDCITGAEALVRWKHPVLGMLSPGKFIPVFEKNGFITKLDAYVIEKVCSHIKGWVKKGIEIPVSVNISYMDLMEDGWVDRQLETISASGVGNRLIHIELTESMYYENVKYISDLISKFRKSGCLIEMDDFGSGYSTLGMLSEFHIDILKIDASLISKLEKNELLVDTIIGLAHKMDCKVVAEGVENYSQYVKLKALECDYIQGYYMSSPVDSIQFAAYLSNEIEKQKIRRESGGIWNEATKEYEIRNALLECINTLSAPGDDEIKINNLLSIISRFYGADRACIYEFDDDMTVMTNTYEWCREGIPPRDSKLQARDISLAAPWIARFNDDSAVFIAKVSEEAARNNKAGIILHQQKVETVMISKLARGSRTVGFIEVDNPMIHFDTLVLMESISSYIINDLARTKNYRMLRNISYKDALTGVNNRYAYLEYLKSAAASDDDRSVAVAFIDINNLKITNDRFGHEAGDNLIRSIATVLRSNFSSDTIYRFGGDEFVVIIRGIPEDSFKTRMRKLDTFWTANISASVGYSWSPSYAPIDDLVAKADENMYKSKQEYHSTFNGVERRKNRR